MALKRDESGGRTFHPDFYLATTIANPARKSQFVGDAADERAKADALHATGYENMKSLNGIYHPSLNRSSQQVAVSDSFRTPAAHQMRQAPSSETMQGPTGLRGVQGEP